MDWSDREWIIDDENYDLGELLSGYVFDFNQLKNTISCISDEEILNKAKEYFAYLTKHGSYIKGKADVNSSRSIRRIKNIFYNAQNEFEINKDNWQKILNEREEKLKRLAKFDMNNLTEEQKTELREEDENCEYMKVQKELNDINEINERFKDKFEPDHVYDVPIDHENKKEENHQNEENNKN